MQSLTQSLYLFIVHVDAKEAEVKKLKADIDELGVTAAQALELGDKVKTLEAEVKHLNKETNRLTEAYNTERVGNRHSKKSNSHPFQHHKELNE